MTSREQPTNETKKCPKCGTTMCELSDEKMIHGMTLTVPNGTFMCYRCETKGEPAAVPTPVPLEAREWLKFTYSKDIALFVGKMEFTFKELAELLESYSSHVNAAQVEYWHELYLDAHRDWKLSEERNAAAMEKLATLENWLDGRECLRCGYVVSGRDWKAIARPASEVRCVGCRGNFGEWQRFDVRRLTEELGKRGSETAEFRERVMRAESRISELERELSTAREALRKLEGEYRDLAEDTKASEVERSRNAAKFSREGY